MDEQHQYSLEDTLRFFILHTLRQEALPDFVIEQRMQPIHRMLELAAERSGKAGPGLTRIALQELERTGWLAVEWQPAQAGPQRMYSVTPVGRKELEAQERDRSSALKSFVEDRALDDTLRKFLNRDV